MISSVTKQSVTVVVMNKNCNGFFNVFLYSSYFALGWLYDLNNKGSYFVAINPPVYKITISDLLLSHYQIFIHHKRTCCHRLEVYKHFKAKKRLFRTQRNINYLKKFTISVPIISDVWPAEDSGRLTKLVIILTNLIL